MDQKVLDQEKSGRSGSGGSASFSFMHVSNSNTVWTQLVELPLNLVKSLLPHDLTELDNDSSNCRFFMAEGE